MTPLPLERKLFAMTSLQKTAMELPASEKMALIDLLWESLEGEEVAARQQRWAEESEDRIDAFDRGEISAADGPSALQEIRRSLRG